MDRIFFLRKKYRFCKQKLNMRVKNFFLNTLIDTEKPIIN
nr:MAG TPA_asm: hypothetical protein [Caudoviricetes sp.]